MTAWHRPPPAKRRKRTPKSPVMPAQTPAPVDLPPVLISYEIDPWRKKP